MKTLRDLKLRNQTVFLRVDFNVPLDKKMNITEDARITAALPTIQYIREQEGKLIIASHLGRPKGGFDARLGMRPIAKRLQELLGIDVVLASDCIGAEVEKLKAELQPGQVLMLENLRFYEQEEQNDLHFAERLAQGVDVYVTDAFGALHRKHASTHALPRLIFDKAAGFLIEQEITALDKISHDPEQPMVLIIGGGKISDKVDVIRTLMPKSDVVLIGGGLANTFLKAQEYVIGKSIIESDSIDGEPTVSSVDIARDVLQRASVDIPTINVKLPNGEKLTKVVVPVDMVAASSAEPGAETKVINLEKDAIDPTWMFLDIGPQTRKLYAEILKQAKTVFWNGPLGLFEVEPFAAGSHEVATAIADSKAYAVLGGGDTEAVIKQAGLQGRFAHVSTGGGASLEYIANGTLPGLEALE